MILEDVKELFDGFGYELSSFYPKDLHKYRFRKGELFMDVWIGKKGTTIGIYNPETGLMYFKRKVGLVDIEKAINETHNGMGY
jgi:hypothetical protein